MSEIISELYNDIYTNQLLDFIIEDIDSGKKFNDFVKDADDMFKLINNDGSDKKSYRINLTPQNDKILKVNLKDGDVDTKEIKVKYKEDKGSSKNIKDEDSDLDDLVNKEINKQDDSNNTKSVKVKLKDDKDDAVKVKLKDDKDNSIKVKLRDEKDDPNAIKIKIPDTEKKVVDVKLKPKSVDEKHKEQEQELINKLANNEDLKEMLRDKNPSSILGTCLDILENTKISVEKLIILLTDDLILIKTHHLIGQLINKIIENHDAITDNLEQCQQLAVQTVKLTIDLKNYLKIKSEELKTQINNSNNKDDEVQLQLDKVDEVVKKNNINEKEEKNKGIESSAAEFNNKSKPPKQSMAGNPSYNLS